MNCELAQTDNISGQFSESFKLSEVLQFQMSASNSSCTFTLLKSSKVLFHITACQDFFKEVIF